MLILFLSTAEVKLKTAAWRARWKRSFKAEKERVMLLESCILPNCPMETKRSAGTAWGFSPLLQSRFNEIPFFSFFFSERHTGSISTALAEPLHIWGWGVQKEKWAPVGLHSALPCGCSTWGCNGLKGSHGHRENTGTKPFPPLITTIVTIINPENK